MPPLPTGSLRGCRARVERAKEHRDALDCYIAETFSIEANRPRLGIKFEAETSQHVVYINQVPDLSEFCIRSGLIFGDCINNLRIALDYLTFQLARWHTRGSIVHEDRITFPITDNPKAWPAIEGKELREIHPAHRAQIERFQPYHRTHFQPLQPGLADTFHPLALLRDLTKADKHRLLTKVIIPAGRGSSGGAARWLYDIFYTAAMQQALRVEQMLAPAELGAEITRIQMPTDFPKDEVEVAGYAVPEVTLAEPVKRPILPVIDTLAAFVVKVLREFEPTLERRAISPPGIHG